VWKNSARGISVSRPGMVISSWGTRFVRKERYVQAQLMPEMAAGKKRKVPQSTVAYEYRVQKKTKGVGAKVDGNNCLGNGGRG